MKKIECEMEKVKGDYIKSRFLHFTFHISHILFIR